MNYNSIKVNRLQNNAGLFIGRNMQSQWKHRARISDGFGKIVGNANKIMNNSTIVREEPGSGMPGFPL